MNKLVEKFKEFGLNSYEAKIYLELLNNHPATGYEISKTSGVPQARVYDTLRALEDKFIVATVKTNPATYSPIPPEELLDRFEKTMRSSLDVLRTGIPRLDRMIVEPVLNIWGNKEIFEKAREIIRESNTEIFLEIHSLDSNQVLECLREAYDRGVEIKVVGYDDLKMDFGTVYNHGPGGIIENEHGGRVIVLVADQSTAIVGTISEEKGSRVAWTRNKGISWIIRELVVHDIYILEIKKALGDTLNERFGPDLINLRNMVKGRVKQ
jgi:HTH-type transcriptional regulator, sugar sensing transcriptional regulator